VRSVCCGADGNCNIIVVVTRRSNGVVLGVVCGMLLPCEGRAFLVDLAQVAPSSMHSASIHSQSPLLKHSNTRSQ
jgi:hypothetical protein